MLEFIILGFLQNKEKTMYDIRKGMEQSIDFFYSSSLGSINPALKKLQKQDYIDCSEFIENSRLKKKYSITRSGREAYKSWLATPIETGRIKEDSLVRLFFLSDAEPELRKKLIKDYLETLQQMKGELEILKQNFSDVDYPEELKEKAKYQMATLQFGIEYFDFNKKWFRKFLKEMDS